MDDEAGWHDPTGHRALGRIDAALAERPGKNDLALSEATMCLATLRDRLIAVRRASGLRPAQREQLDHLNAIITVVLGVHFPLGDIPWDELDRARGWLAALVDNAEAAR